MAQVSRQQGQAALGVLIGTIPINQRLGREAVPKVMQPRPVASRWATQPDLPGEGIEGAVDLAAV